MKSTIQTIYILENPEKNTVKFATGYQLRYDNVIKDVFGVACINDLHMMIHFNKSFQSSICKSNGINENKITLNHIIRVANKNELLLLKNQILDQNESHVSFASIPCPFDETIKLQEGIFTWDEKQSSYTPA